MHVLVDNLGRLLGLVLSPGQANDCAYAATLAEQAIQNNACVVIGDKGYDSNMLRTLLTSAGVEPIIPFRKCCKVRPELDREREKERRECCQR
jgi:transposase